MATGINNKQALMQFLFECWSKCNPVVRGSIPVYVTHGNECHRIAPSGNGAVVEKIQELQCDHKEADTRMFLHALHASRNHENIVIKSLDINVFVTALYLKWFLASSVFLETVTRDTYRNLSIDAIAITTGRDVCMALPGLHTLTGVYKYIHIL